MALKELTFDIINKIPSTRLVFIGRYTTVNGSKYYLLREPENDSADYGFKIFSNFIAYPKFYEEKNHEPPKMRFTFSVGKLFWMTNRLEPQLTTFLEKYGEYYFKKWLNQLNDAPPQTGEMLLSAGNEEAKPEFSNGTLRFPIDKEEDDRLQAIAESEILNAFYEKRGRGPIEVLDLREKAFVPDDIYNYVMGLIRSDGLIQEGNGSLTKKGIAYLKDEGEGKRINNAFSVTVFVAQAFNPEMENIFTKVFEPVIKSFKLNPIKINETESDDPIDVAILNQILQARFVICDLTFARPSVYFEAGFAMGNGIKVIYTSREDHNSDHPNFMAVSNKIHFDLRNRQITWWDSENLIQFHEEISARIERFLEIQKGV